MQDSGSLLVFGFYREMVLNKKLFQNYNERKIYYYLLAVASWLAAIGNYSKCHVCIAYTILTA